jgi:hypothetical protein
MVKTQSKTMPLDTQAPTEERARGRELQHGQKLVLQRVQLVLERGVNDAAKNGREMESRIIKRLRMT